MQVNFGGAEYDLLREVADHYRSTPAHLVHEWVMERLGVEFASLKARRREDGILVEDGIPSPAKIRSDSDHGG